MVITGSDTKEFETANALYSIPTDIDGSMNCIPFPEVNNQLLNFTDIERQVVVLTPLLQEPYLLSVGCFIIIGDQAHNDVVVSKLYDGVGVVSGHTILCEHGVQQQTENAALRGEEIQDPVAQIGSGPTVFGKAWMAQQL